MPVCASPLIFSPPPVDLQLAAVRNGDGLLSGAVLGADLLDGLDDLKTLNNLAEDDVLAVQPGGLDGADEELGAVGSRSGVSHGEDTGASVPQVEVLVLELLAVDALTSGAVAAGEVTTLEHELGDDAVEAGALVVEGLAALSSALLAGAESAEVLSGLGDLVGEELHDDPASGLAANGGVEENLGVGHGDGFGLSVL